MIKDNCYSNEDLKLVSKGDIFPNGGISLIGYNYYVANGKGNLPVPEKNKETFYVLSSNKPDKKIFATSDFISDFSKSMRQMMAGVIVFTDGTGKGVFPLNPKDVEKSWNQLLFNYNKGTELYLYSLNNDKSNLIRSTYGCAYIDNGGDNSFPCGKWKNNFNNNQPCSHNSGNTVDCSSVLNECCKNICPDYSKLKPNDTCEDNN